MSSLLSAAVVLRWRDNWMALSTPTTAGAMSDRASTTTHCLPISDGRLGYEFLAFCGGGLALARQLDGLVHPDDRRRDERQGEHDHPLPSDLGRPARL